MGIVRDPSVWRFISSPPSLKRPVGSSGGPSLVAGFSVCDIGTLLISRVIYSISDVIPVNMYEYNIIYGRVEFARSILIDCGIPVRDHHAPYRRFGKLVL